MKVFISYSHRQGSWVWERLVPVLRAAGCAEVLADKERFLAGRDVFAQMDALQDAADLSLLVLSPEYLASAACRHEMDRAITGDPDFSRGKVLPVKRADCDMTAFTSRPKVPLWVNLADERDPGAWNLLLKTLDAMKLGATAPHWLDVRDELVRRFCDNRESVNLLTHGEPNWSAMLDNLKQGWVPNLATVNLDDPSTASQEGLVRQMLFAFGVSATIARGAHSVAALNELKSIPGPLFLALKKFDNVSARRRTPRIVGYHPDLFFALRYLVSDERKLVLLVQSWTPFSELWPKDHALSPLTLPTIVMRELRA